MERLRDIRDFVGELLARRIPSQELAKSRDREIERRLHACEVNLQNIWEHLNGNPGNR